jgi:hypothetical protein
MVTPMTSKNKDPRNFRADSDQTCSLCFVGILDSGNNTADCGFEARLELLETTRAVSSLCE